MHAKDREHSAPHVTHDITNTQSKIILGNRETDRNVCPFLHRAGERGAADAERDIRGFAMKFYTERELGFGGK